MSYANETYIFELISHAGNSRSKAMEALEASRDKNMRDAERFLVEAHDELILAHRSQTKLLFEEAKGDHVEMNVLLTHALDHLTMATMSYDFASEIIMLRKEIGGM